MPVPRGPSHYKWKGGKSPSKTSPHLMTRQDDHPFANRDGYVMTHRLIAEKALGRYLDPRNVVHHVDRNPINNANSNLVICEDQAYHALLHRRMRAYEACGNPNARKCWICGQWGMDVIEQGNSDCAHRACRNERDRPRNRMRMRRYRAALKQRKGAKS